MLLFVQLRSLQPIYKSDIKGVQPVERLQIAGQWKAS